MNALIKEIGSASHLTMGVYGDSWEGITGHFGTYQ